MRDWGVTI
uniref:Uncharacterized protein n=1 Tax=Arundo donax TaxID=35708 RepID=A0A0A8ZJF6_ARUDO